CPEVGLEWRRDGASQRLSDRARAQAQPPRRPRRAYAADPSRRRAAIAAVPWPAERRPGVPAILRDRQAPAARLGTRAGDRALPPAPRTGRRNAWELWARADRRGPLRCH